ncbi:unnamed protein product [Coregonus sp. 'balchen']|nr:unnamed protein product [Coregonus sp. 'balchen']
MGIQGTFKCPFNRSKVSECAPITHGCIQSLLLKFSAQELFQVSQPSMATSSSSSSTLVISVDHTQLWPLIGGGALAQRMGAKQKAEDQAHHKQPALPSAHFLHHPGTGFQLARPSDWKVGGGMGGADKQGRTSKGQTPHLDMEIESLLNQQSTKKQQSKKMSRVILELLNTSTAKEQSIVEKFRSCGRTQVQEFCDHGTKKECMRSGFTHQPCTKQHFRRVLEKLSVVMADPPWDIHMGLPDGTLTDNEMRKLHIPFLQDDGFLFLWVTGRAMELGVEGLSLVVGVKESPQGFNKGLDCDVIVAEVRSTSHKPDEINGMIERLLPGTRKIELFGRPHNVQPNWVTLANQLEGIHLLDPDVVARFKKCYPDGVISKLKNM